MKKICQTVLCIAALVCTAVNLSGQTVVFYRDFQYPQTPTFTDQTGPANAAGNIDTVWSYKKQERMSQPTVDRRKFGSIMQVYVISGALEPDNNYDFAMTGFINAKYIPGTFSYSGPADSLICITNFSWGTENNNGNFLPLLITRDYQDIKEPTFDFSWFQPTGYNIKDSQVIPMRDQIALNYNFKIPAQAKTYRADAPQFKRFSVAGGASGKVPAIVNDNIFRWGYSGLEVFSNSIVRSSPVKNNIAVPKGQYITGFAIDADSGMIFIALTNQKIMALTLDGTAYWECNGQAPLIVYKDKLLVISADYSQLLVLKAATGEQVEAIDLPSFLPRNENSMATFSTTVGDMLLLAIPSQSRVLCYLIVKSK